MAGDSIIDDYGKLILKQYAARRQQREELSKRLSTALTGVPHGPYIEPKFYPRYHHRPGEIIPDSDKPYVFPVVYDGEIHYFYGKPRLPKNGLDAHKANQYIKAFNAYKKEQDAYDVGKGVQREKFDATYQKKYDEYQRKHYAWAQRRNKADVNIEKRDVTKRIREQRKSAKIAFGPSNKKWNGVNYAGFTPWDPRYGEFKRLTAKQYKDIGASYRNLKHPEKKTITLWNGKKARVIDSELGVPLGFSKMFGYNGASETVTDEKTGITSTDYAEEAFSGKHRTHDWQGDNSGHITAISYSAYYQLLKVTFRAGAICIYYRVPSTVAGELLKFAETGATMRSAVDGKERHVLGIRFWDLVRIRGTKHGSRYRFEYQSGNDRTATSATYIPAFGNVAERTGYDINALKEWKESFKAKNGREPTPAEFKNKVAELTAKEGMQRRTMASSDKIADALLGDVETGGSTMIKIPQYKRAITADDIDEYFDGNMYNNDLVNGKIDQKKLRKAFDMYMNMDDNDKIVNQLKAAGVNMDIHVENTEQYESEDDYMPAELRKSMASDI